MLDNVGWLGSTLLAFCGLPQALESWKTKNSNGLTWGFLLAWTLGELCTLVYVLPRLDWPLIFNYSANLIFLGIILFFKIWPKQ
jgi:uncharacterized protein with PQ loop repeat